MSGMFWIALELSIPKIGFNIMLSLAVKKLDAFKFDGVAESGNTGLRSRDYSRSRKKIEPSSRWSIERNHEHGRIEDYGNCCNINSSPIRNDFQSGPTNSRKRNETRQNSKLLVASLFTDSFSLVGKWRVRYESTT